jgi:hypothetical protein
MLIFDHYAEIVAEENFPLRETDLEELLNCERGFVIEMS